MLLPALAGASQAPKRPPRLTSYALAPGPAFKMESPHAGRMLSPSHPAGIGKPRFSARQDEALSFGCRRRALAGVVKSRDMSACFAGDMDKSLKAHTYVSKGVSHGRENWAGGVVLDYAY